MKAPLEIKMERSRTKNKLTSILIQGLIGTLFFTGIFVFWVNDAIIIGLLAVAMLGLWYLKKQVSQLQEKRSLIEPEQKGAWVLEGFGHWEIDFLRGEVVLDVAAAQLHGLKEHRVLPLEEYGYRLRDKRKYESLLQKLRSSTGVKRAGIAGEFQVITLEGLGKWVKIVGGPIMEGDHCVGAKGILEDIQERKERELTFLQEKQRLEQLLPGTGLSLWEWDLGSNRVHLQEGLPESLGYTKSELSPCTLSRFLSLIHPHDLEASQHAFRCYLAGEAEAYRVTLRMKHRNGDWLWILVHGKVLHWDENGAPAWMYGFHQLYTEEKRNRDELATHKQYVHSLAACIPDLLFILSNEGVFLDYKAGENDLYTSPDLFLGKNFRDVFPTPLKDRMEESILSCIRTNALVEFTYELEIKGKLRFYAARIVPFEDDKVVVLCREQLRPDKKTAPRF